MGRQMKTWLEDVEEDLNQMGIKVWRREAQDRNACSIILTEALALHWAVMPMIVYMSDVAVITVLFEISDFSVKYYSFRL